MQLAEYTAEGSQDVFSYINRDTYPARFQKMSA